MTNSWVNSSNVNFNVTLYICTSELLLFNDCIAINPSVSNLVWFSAGDVDLLFGFVYWNIGWSDLESLLLLLLWSGIPKIGGGVGGVVDFDDYHWLLLLLVFK